MLKREEWPWKKRSQRGNMGRGPRVRNMKATLGILEKGYDSFFGIKEALQKSSSSDRQWVRLRG